MTKPFAAEYPVEQAKDRIIVALDVATADQAREIVAELGGSAGAYKVGSQLFTATGPEFVRELTGAGHRVFLDLKFHDIPNTVANAAVEACRLGVWMLNVHALGGGEMMRRTVDELRSACEREGMKRPLLVAVTVLTSSNDVSLREAGIETTVEAEVIRLAKLAADCGLDGVVASPHEARAIRAAVADTSRPFSIVTPGIRPSDATIDDQKRVTTIADAFAKGSDYVVIGRPILEAADRREAVRKFVVEAERYQ
jgi:orotidine-5'-phosphate decarboxylase